MNTKIILTLVALLIAPTAFSANICGSAKILEGTTCETLKVEFDLTGCDAKQASVPAKMVCGKKSKYAVANVDGAEYRALVTMSGGGGGWGGESISIQGVEPDPRKSKGGIVAESPKQKVIIEKPAAPIVLAAPKSAVNVSGFVDAQVQHSSEQGSNRSFLVNDGAIYFTREEGTVDFKLDLPFRMFTSGAADFDFAKSKAQAYVGEKKPSGFRYRIGQFDTPYGFDVNDTVDGPFSRQGNVYNFTDPFVHTGVLLGWDFTSEIGVNMIVGSPNDTGVLIGRTPQYGLQFAKTGNERLTFGFLTNRDIVTGQYNMFVDVVAGINVGKFIFDAEWNMNRSYSELAPDGTLLPIGYSYLFQSMYVFDARWQLGTRIEFLENWGKHDPRILTAQERLRKQLLIFLGPQLHVTQNMTLKFDVSIQSEQKFDGYKGAAIRGANFAAVYRF